MRHGPLRLPLLVQVAVTFDSIARACEESQFAQCPQRNVQHLVAPAPISLLQRQTVFQPHWVALNEEGVYVPTGEVASDPSWDQWVRTADQGKKARLQRAPAPGTTWKHGPQQQKEKQEKEKKKEEKQEEEKKDLREAERRAEEADPIGGLEGMVNRPDDIKALLRALATNAGLVFVYVVIFCFLRGSFPLVYMHNVFLKRAAKHLQILRSRGCCGWACICCTEALEEVENLIGLDGAMFLEFPRFCWRVLMTIAVPLLVVAWPLQCGSVRNEGGICLPVFFRDELNIGFKIFWLQAGAVWFVVLAVEFHVLLAQRAFARRREAWLRRKPAPWSTTILVENVPRDLRSDSEFRRFFEQRFPTATVEAAQLVKRTGNLASLVSAAEEARHFLTEANSKWKRTGYAPDQRPTHPGISGQVDSIFFYGEEVKSTEQAATESLERFRRGLRAGEEGLISGSGFVTFRHQKEAALALDMSFRVKGHLLEISTPPEPEDVVYTDLMQEKPERLVMEFTGHILVGMVFFLFTPLTLAIISITRLKTLRKYVPLFNMIVTKYPEIHAFWDGMVGSGILSLVMGFVPTIFSLIFKYFFCLKSELWRQQRVQRWYFYFLVIFVLLITAVGASLAMVYLELFEDPARIFKLLADSLPGASQFYLKFMMFQWAAETLQLARHVVLVKFLLYRMVHEEDRARLLSEPEDQDYQGIGARSARLTLMLVIALVFSTISPLVCPLAIVHFLLCRAVFSYLLIFAEGKKNDLGGVFWCTQMQHVQQGMFCYVALMVGVLLERAKTPIPGLIAAGTLVVMVPCYIYSRNLAWETLPFEEVEDCDTTPQTTTSQASRTSYEQPELRGCDFR